MTKPTLSNFAGKLLAEWVRLDLPRADTSIVIGVSGGADSSALLVAFAELIEEGKLGLKLIAAHLDHGLRTDSPRDAQWVSQLVKTLGSDVEIEIGKVDLKGRLKNTGGGPKANLEQAARKARYDFLEKIANKKNAKLLLTAHTLDDQAETILMRLLRGSAAEGLSSILPVRSLATNSDIRLIRPLVSWAYRSDTENYCRLGKIDFRVDEMNHDEAFSRVRIRKQLLPLMKSFNPRIVDALNRTAALLGEDAEALSDIARKLLDLASLGSRKTHETNLPSLSVNVLLQAPAAVRRRALREWILRARGDLHRLEMVHLLAVEGLLRNARGGRVAELPGGMKVTRKRGMLELSNKKVVKGSADL